LFTRGESREGGGEGVCSILALGSRLRIMDFALGIKLKRVKKARQGGAKSNVLTIVQTHEAGPRGRNFFQKKTLPEKPFFVIVKRVGPLRSR